MKIEYNLSLGTQPNEQQIWRHLEVPETVSSIRFVDETYKWITIKLWQMLRIKNTVRTHGRILYKVTCPVPKWPIPHTEFVQLRLAPVLDGDNGWLELTRRECKLAGRCNSSEKVFLLVWDMFHWHPTLLGDQTGSWSWTSHVGNGPAVTIWSGAQFGSCWGQLPRQVRQVQSRVGYEMDATDPGLDRAWVA